MRALPLEELTEKDLARQVAELAALTGWRRYHTYRSERSQPGFPDETLVRDRVVFLELKTEKGRLSPAQRDWLRALLEAKAEAYVVRPRHLDQLARVLASRTGIPSLARDELAALTRAEVGGAREEAA